MNGPLLPCRLAGPLLLLLAAGCAGAGRQPEDLVLHTRARDGERVVERTVRWDSGRTAIVVVDMWDSVSLVSGRRAPRVRLALP